MSQSQLPRQTLEVERLPSSSGARLSYTNNHSKKKVTFAIPLEQVIKVGHRVPDASSEHVGAATATEKDLHSTSFAATVPTDERWCPRALLKLLSEPDQPVNLSSFNQALDVFAGEGLVDLARAAFVVMHKRGVEPNATSNALLCKALAQTGEVEGIVLVMDSFKARGGELNEHFYDALGTALSLKPTPTLTTENAGPWEQAAQIARIHLWARAVAAMNEHAKGSLAAKDFS